MNQRKMGEFLKLLRNEKNLTQEQLAEHFYVSSRTVSRWETGNNMPDLDMLIDLADFYEVDIYEIIDGERKSEKVENEIKLTLKKVVEYAAEDKKIRRLVCLAVMFGTLLLSDVFLMLFEKENKGLLYGVVPENICGIFVWSSLGLQLVALIIYLFDASGVLDKILAWKKKKER